MEGIDHYDHQSDYNGDIGTCIACLYKEELDNSGLCAGCNPINEDTRVALIALLTPSNHSLIIEAAS